MSTGPYIPLVPPIPPVAPLKYLDVYSDQCMAQPRAEYGMYMPSMEDPTVAAVNNMTAEEAASLGEMMSGARVDADEKKKKPHLRKSAGDIWCDASLDEWPENDFRIFCGDLGNEVTDEILTNAFRRYESFQKAKVIRDRRSCKSKGYGFVSFLDPHDMLRAIKEMNRKYVGIRPIRTMRSKWKDREIDSEKNKYMESCRLNKETCKKLRKFKKIGVPVNGGRKERERLKARPYSLIPTKTNILNASDPTVGALTTGGGRKGRGYYGPGGTGRLTHYQKDGEGKPLLCQKALQFANKHNAHAQGMNSSACDNHLLDSI